MTSFYFKECVYLLTKILFRYFVFNFPQNFSEGRSPAALKDELAPVVDLCVHRCTSTTEQQADIPSDIRNGHKNFKRSN
jgi:hypothetical protein